MARDKKSFVLYADLIHTVRKMSKAKAGELFLTILQYVNDENPVVEDEMIDLVFEPIKQQMKRDLKKYEEIRGKRAEFGKLGGLAKATKRQQEPDDAKQNLANVPVNDNVNVNDNVIKIRQNFDILESQQIWKEQTMMALKLDSTKFKIAFDSFKAQHIMAGQVKPLAELMDHFSKWYPKAKANLFTNQTTQIYNKI